MYFTTAVASIAALAVSVLAVPPPPTGVHVVAVNGKSDFFPNQGFNDALTAAHSKLFLNNAHQNAKCAGHAEVAFFRIDDKSGKLFLYNNNKSDPVQQIYVLPADGESWEVGYVTGTQKRTPPGIDFAGWKIDSANNLLWRGQKLMACPNQADGSWSIWLSKNGNPGCTHFDAKATKAQYPNECEYTQ